MIGTKKDGDASSNKSIVNSKIVISLIASITIAAFFGGYFVGDMNNSDTIKLSDIERLLNDRDVLPRIQEHEETPPNPVIFVSLDDDPIKGDPNAPLTIVEFSDFQCPFCARFYHETLPEIEQEYIKTGKVNIVYRDMPLGIHDNAIPAHVAAECADVQDAFWEYHDILFQRQSEWNDLEHIALENKLIAYAQELELDSTFESCIKSDSIKQEVEKDYSEASYYGATGTPTFFIGNPDDGYIKISGAQPFSTFKNIIESKLNN